MTALPPIKEHIVPRGGKYNGAHPHFTPDESKVDFWGSFYEKMADSFSLDLPFSDADKKINPYFGYFGSRFHPRKKEPHYFHAGVDFDGAPKTKVFPVAKGILEYSGFGVVNGKYVMISHPEIKTEDGFVLHSLYMHLKDLKVGFNSYQKMLREVSFNTYPQIEVNKDCELGIMGQTGNAKGYPHLHLQLEFRNEKGDIVLIDPLQAMGLPPGESLSRDIETEKQYENFVEKYRNNMIKSNLRAFIEDK
jgi:murein DD-endopeptidase MepM/ murein hydrolase activator NlpD